MDPVYFDHNATTPVDDRVFEAMLQQHGFCIDDRNATVTKCGEDLLVDHVMRG